MPIERIPRVYVDTSVFGGLFDIEFSKASDQFLHRIRRGDFKVVISGVVLNEIAQAPLSIRETLQDLLSLQTRSLMAHEAQSM